MSEGAIKCGLTLALLAALPAIISGTVQVRAQENNRPLTIADCPKGYRLGIAESDQPQPIARAPDYMPPRTGPETVAAAREAAGAPRAFITGCIPPQTKENTQ